MYSQFYDLTVLYVADVIRVERTLHIKSRDLREMPCSPFFGMFPAILSPYRPESATLAPTTLLLVPGTT